MAISFRDIWEVFSYPERGGRIYGMSIIGLNLVFAAAEKQLQGKDQEAESMKRQLIEDLPLLGIPVTEEQVGEIIDTVKKHTLIIAGIIFNHDGTVRYP